MKPLASTKPTLLDPTACPTCRAPLESLLFCPRDGSIGREGRFTVATRYVAEELLGAGERSFVYAGSHGDKPIAIKLLRDADTSASSPATRRFLRGARNASQLALDHTIAIHDFGYDELLGAPFIAMELFSGQSLERVLRTSGPMAPARAIPILVQIARSLGDAHTGGVLHREVGSRSVLVGRGDVVKVGDYGLGRGDDASGSEGDVFGLASIGVEMLLGRAPASPLAMLEKVSPGVPLELRALLAQCLDPSTSARPRALDIEARLLAIGTRPLTVPPVPEVVVQVVAASVEPVVAPTAIVAAPVESVPEPVPVATTAPIAIAPVAIAPVVTVDNAEPPSIAPADSLDALPIEPPEDSYEITPRRPWGWLAGGGVVSVAVMIALVVHATGGNERAAQTLAPTPIAAPTPKKSPPAPVPVPTPEPAPAPTPTPEVAAASLPEPAPVAPSTPTPAPAAPKALATVASATLLPPPSQAKPPATPIPAQTATPKKKPKHKDDAVIVDPFSD